METYVACFPALESDCIFYTLKVFRTLVNRDYVFVWFLESFGFSFRVLIQVYTQCKTC